MIPAVFTICVVTTGLIIRVSVRTTLLNTVHALLIRLLFTLSTDCVNSISTCGVPHSLSISNFNAV